MSINAEQLKRLHIDAKWVDPLNETFERFGISSVKIGPVEVEILYDTKYWTFCFMQLVVYRMNNNNKKVK